MKPDSERANRNPKPFEWVDLPARNGVPAPDLPVLPVKKLKQADGSVVDVQQVWPVWAVETWQRLWASPQSTQWSRTDHYSAVEQWLTLYVSFKNGDFSGAVLNQLQRIEDKLGLNPKAMLALRWRYSGEVAAESGEIAAVRPLKSVRADPRAV
jgi:hypothetical protein